MDVKRNGRFQRTRQRWFCRVCHRSFVWRNTGSRSHQHAVWFKRWIVDGYTIDQLSRQSGHSVSSIRRIIEYWLQQAPPGPQQSLASHTSIMIDGTFITRRKGILAVMDAMDHRVVYGEYNVAEHVRDLGAVFGALGRQGLSPQFVTLDGHPALSHAVQHQWPQAVVQRCLIHIQRQGLSWCRRTPKRTDAKHLRKIFLDVTTIRSSAEQAIFLRRVAAWERTYGLRIATSPEHGYVFSDLKRARSMLMAALPNMFHYLQHPSVAISTNALEGYFSRLKQRYRQHRGLAVRHRGAYFQWYVALCDH